MIRLSGLALAGLVLAGCEKPPPESVQRGYRGVGMVEVYNPYKVDELIAVNFVPEPLAPVPAGGPPASAVYKNVQVLGNLGIAEFTRTMLAITAWVAPKQGCAYCHNTANMADDSLYTKIVARRMLQMTQHVNATWKPHVAATGVTCYTCHRGNPVPANIWYNDPGPVTAENAGNKGGQNLPAVAAGYASLPYDPFSTFLEGAESIRITGPTALPTGNTHSIKQAEWTFSLMIHMSKSLGVNCTYCHNSRAFADWSQSPPQRVTAWYGIRMVRDLNNDYLDPLKTVFPDYRHGPLGDAPKLNCATCHQGAYKPLFGASMLKEYPQFSGPIAAPAEAAPAAEPEAPMTPPADKTTDAGTRTGVAPLKTSASTTEGAMPPA